jgi:hypothetical protein
MTSCRWSASRRPWSEQYFYPILRGDLVVEVWTATRMQRIAADTIETPHRGEDRRRACAR